MRLRGGEPLPDDADVSLGRNERVLTYGRLADGRYAAATEFGLRIGGAPPVFHPWHEVDHARWTDDGTLDLEPLDGAPVRYRFADPRGVPAAVREQVTLSVAISERHPIDGPYGARIVARRDAATGRVIWSAIVDAELDANDPAVRERAEQILHAVRRRAGG
jgi:hypothetical protein